MSKKPTVFVVKEQMMRGDLGSVAMDYGPAMHYGDLQFVTTTDMPLHPGSSVQQVWDAEVDRFAREYNEQTDFVIPTGQPMAIFCVGWWLGMVGKSPRFLVWRPQENQYRVVCFNGKAPFNAAA